MPRLSDTMEEGTVASWIKKEGDNVEEGDILAEIETDKATMEFESFQSGTLLYIGLKEGESAKVDDLLAIIGPAGTDVSAVAKNFTVSAPAAKAEQAPKPVAKTEAPKQEAAAETKAPKRTTNNTPDGRIHISPLAKKLAEERNINLKHITGTGENGRIVKRDIEDYNPAAAGAVGKFVASGQEDFDEVPNSQMRKVIAKRLGESKFSAPHYYLAVEFDMG